MPEKPAFPKYVMERCLRNGGFHENLAFSYATSSKTLNAQHAFGILFFQRCVLPSSRELTASRPHLAHDVPMFCSGSSALTCHKMAKNAAPAPHPPWASADLTHPVNNSVRTIGKNQILSHICPPPLLILENHRSSFGAVSGQGNCTGIFPKGAIGLATRCAWSELMRLGAWGKRLTCIKIFNWPR